MLLLSLATKTSPAGCLSEAPCVAGRDAGRTALGNAASTLEPRDVVRCVLEYGEKSSQVVL